MKTISELRREFTAYYANPMAHIDSKSIDEWNLEKGEYLVKCKPVSEVLNIPLLGSGAYANVYAISETKVLKVLKSEDTGYSRFVETIKGRNNKHLPVIYFSGIWAGKQVFILERLQTTSSDPIISEKGWNRGEDVTYAMFTTALRACVEDNPFITADKELREIASMKQEYSWDDIHSANVMFRGNVPVITDPAAD